MMDLIRFLLPQQSTSNDQNNDLLKIEEVEDKANFTELMSDLLIEDNQINEKQLSKIDSKPWDEETEIESESDNDLVPDGLESPVFSQSQNAIENPVEPVKQNYTTPLDWFDSEAFIPPSGERDIETGEEISSLAVSEINTQDEQNDTMELSINEASVESMLQPAAQFIPVISKDVVQTPTEHAIEPNQQESQLNKTGSIQPKVISEVVSGQIDELEQDQTFAQNEPIVEISSYIEPELVTEQANKQRSKAFDEVSTLNSTVKNIPFTELNQRAPGVNESVSAEINNLALNTNITNPDWSEQFHQQIIWLGQQEIKTAIIRLNPEDLGPLEVKIDLIKDETSLNIKTNTAEVSHLIEQAIPRLREMMTQQGLNLLQVNIESNANQHHSSKQEYSPRSTNDAEGEKSLPLEKRAKISTGLIDYFA